MKGVKASSFVIVDGEGIAIYHSPTKPEAMRVFKMLCTHFPERSYVMNQQFAIHSSTSRSDLGGRIDALCDASDVKLHKK